MLPVRAVCCNTINFNYIDEVTYGQIFLDNGMEISLGESYREHFFCLIPVIGRRKRNKKDKQEGSFGG